jgi:hypothetical protein
MNIPTLHGIVFEWISILELYFDKRLVRSFGTLVNGLKTTMSTLWSDCFVCDVINDELLRYKQFHSGHHLSANTRHPIDLSLVSLSLRYQEQNHRVGVLLAFDTGDFHSLHAYYCFSEILVAVVVAVGRFPFLPWFVAVVVVPHSVWVVDDPWVLHDPEMFFAIDQPPLDNSDSSLFLFLL